MKYVIPHRKVGKNTQTVLPLQMKKRSYEELHCKIGRLGSEGIHQLAEDRVARDKKSGQGLKMTLLSLSQRYSDA